MKKIISLFQRNYDGDKLVRDEVVPGAEWVLAGEGVATRKFDGTCCLVRGGVLYKRFDAKHGKKLPVGFEPAQEPNPITGHWPGWLPVGDGPEDRWHVEAWVNQNFTADDGTHVRLPDWTYELCGPKVQGNPEADWIEKEVGKWKHILIPHGRHYCGIPPGSFADIKDWLSTRLIEGIVWWRESGNPDCDKVKIKAKDFGFKRK